MTSFYVYTLYWDDVCYHGYASNMKRRLTEHRSRCKKGTELTAIQQHYDAYGFWFDVEYRAFDNREEAFAFERELVNEDAGEDWCLNRERVG